MARITAARLQSAAVLRGLIPPQLCSPAALAIRGLRGPALVSAHELTNRGHRFEVITRYLKRRKDRNCENHPGNPPHPAPKD